MSASSAARDLALPRGHGWSIYDRAWKWLGWAPAHESAWAYALARSSVYGLVRIVAEPDPRRQP